ncbi:MAG: hypothetical protein Q8Q92_03020 [bacterium]|nr:hypothetical protein [bacterium]
MFNWLIKATTARLIKWEPTTEPPVNLSNGTTMRGYDTRIGYLIVSTIVRKKYPGRKDNDISDIAYAVEIVDYQSRRFVASDDPRCIPGKKSVDGWAMIICHRVQNEVQERDLLGTLTQELAHLVHS